MTFEDYQRNLKGVNAGSDFDPDYLVSLNSFFLCQLLRLSIENCV
jgi:hypothetical protein